MYSEINSIGLPANLFNALYGRPLTAAYYDRYANAFKIDHNANYLPTVTGLENNLTNAQEILQVWQWVDNWGLYFPENVTPVVQRLQNLLIKLRKATDTDGPYSFYELLLFWNVAVYPEKFAPVVFTDSVYSALINNAVELNYEVLFTTVQNLILRTRNQNTPIVDVVDNFPNYEVPNLPPIGNPNPTPTNTPTTANELQSTWGFVGVLIIAFILFYFIRK